jgi:hypothetical protein
MTEPAAIETFIARPWVARMSWTLSIVALPQLSHVK